jgi:hypothetical protein
VTTTSTERQNEVKKVWKRNVRTIAIVGALIITTVGSLGAETKQRMTVTVIDRQNSDSEYSGVVPGAINTNVYQGGAYTTVTPPRETRYTVRGATLALQLPDGRVAVVNCESKYSLKFDYVNKRSCRVPLANTLEVEFKGDNAKLFWLKSVSLDLADRKWESETYKIIAVE